MNTAAGTPARVPGFRGDDRRSWTHVMDTFKASAPQAARPAAPFALGRMLAGACLFFGFIGAVSAQQVNCAAGQSFSATTSSCTNLPVGAPGACPSGQVADGTGGCMAQGITCPPGQIVNPATNSCSFAPAGSTAGCATGQVQNGSGTCVAQSITCPPGQLVNAATNSCSFAPAGSTVGCPTGQVVGSPGTELEFAL